MNTTPVQTVNANIKSVFYKPSELVKIYRDKFSHENYINNQNKHLTFLKGIYIPKDGKVYNGFCYDTLRDESTNDEITIKIPFNERTKMKPNSLIRVIGILEFIILNGTIRINMDVTRVELIKRLALSPTEIKKNEILLYKNKSKGKNVDTILETILYEDKQPVIGLIFGDTSITETDFNRGLNASAKAKVQFVRLRCSFTRAEELINMLKIQDTKGFSAIAIIRGGGGNNNWGALDDIKVLDVIAKMKTPTIAAIGHPDENVFIKKIVDKEVAVPHALGVYFSNMVDDVVGKRQKSKAALVNEVKKQYEKQIIDSQKQNNELNTKLKELTKSYDNGQKLHNEQMNKANTQNQELQKRLDTITKNLTSLTSANNKLQCSITDLTKKNDEYIKQIEAAKTTIKDLNKQLNSTLSWKHIIAAAIISAIATLLIALTLI